MTPQRKYPQADVKILYGLAAGRCSLPNCRSEIILDDSLAKGRQHIGEIGHIVAHSDDWTRGDPSYPREKLDTYENWILLCPTCHATVDVKDSKYTTNDLRSLKENHEAWVQTSLATEIPGVGFAELEVVAKAIAVSPAAPSEDFHITPPLSKMVRNSLTAPIQNLLVMGLSKSREVHSFVEHVALLDSAFPERLKAGFVKEYALLRTSGLAGDSLFEAMHQFASSGNRGFRGQAAGLAVLTYLFERCEVFEK